MSRLPLHCLGALAALGWPAAVASDPPIRFVHREIGFTLEHSESGNRFAPETMAGGLALFDYDNDGDLDLFFANGAELPANAKSSPRFIDRLFENDGAANFRDVTERSGLRGDGFSFGAAVADYDNDGDQDLFVAGLHRYALYRNESDGTFADVTRASGIGAVDSRFGPLWAITGAWLDYDRDGLLDLFVVNYLRWEEGVDPVCDETGVRDYCHPKYYEGAPNRLYRNLGNGRFEDVSESAGIRAHVGKGMGAAVSDVDRDGWSDIFVTNDKLPNFLFRNRGDGSFEEVAFVFTAALPEHGRDVSGMGLDARDVTGDGFPEIVYAALAGETFPLLMNTGEGYFVDISQQSGLAAQVRDMAGFAAIAADFDNDGRKDLFFSRGDVQAHPVHAGVRIDQHNSVFWNASDGTFSAMTDEAGLASAPPRRHRGAAAGDLNGDGRLDLVVTALGHPAEAWINDSDGAGDWLAIELTGTVSNRDGIGATIRLDTASGSQFNSAATSTGYASSSAGPVHFGLGRDAAVESVSVRWPSGSVQTVDEILPGRVLAIREAAPR